MRISPVINETQDWLHFSKDPTPGLYPEPDESSLHLHAPYLFQIHFNIVSAHLCLGLRSGLFPSGIPVKTVMHFSSCPCVLHAPLISSPLIVIIFIVRSLPFYSVRIFSAAICSQTRPLLLYFSTVWWIWTKVYICMYVCMYIYIYIHTHSEVGWDYFEATADQRASRENF
jgi:hypothetical protein